MINYARRKIDVTLRLGKGGIDGTTFDTVKLTGLRVLATITKAVLPTSGIAMVRVYGLTLDHINQFTAAGLQWVNSGKNHMMIEAGDEVSGMTAVFNGQINEAYPDFSRMPDAAFVLIGVAGIGIQLKPVTPTSFKGTVSAETVFSTIADKAGVKLENNGVDTKLDSPYFPGSAWNQAILCSKAADCFAYLDDQKNVLAIVKKTGNRGGEPPIISADTGMIGYPSFQRNQVIFRTLFDPTVEYLKPVLAKTQFTAANGSWIVRQLDYILSAETPDGPWEMTITTYKDDFG